MRLFRPPATASHSSWLKHEKALPLLLDLWRDTPAQPPSARITWPVHWRTRDNVDLRFNCIITAWDDFDAVSANDWHPADAATWAWLEQRR